MSVFAPGLFKDQVFLITGGGTGIGLTIAKHAASLGAKIAICGRKKETLEEACRGELAGCEVLATPCDIRSDEDVERMVKEVLARFGRIDVLVNNAGGQYRTLAEDCKPKARLSARLRGVSLLISPFDRDSTRWCATTYWARGA